MDIWDISYIFKKEPVVTTAIRLQKKSKEISWSMERNSSQVLRNERDHKLLQIEFRIKSLNIVKRNKSIKFIPKEGGN